jgi:hypothetical protein
MARHPIGLSYPPSLGVAVERGLSRSPRPGFFYFIQMVSGVEIPPCPLTLIAGLPS